MAVASEACERVAEVWRLPTATVLRAGRVLREADPNMWPQGAQGRGRAAHVYPQNLFSIAFTMTLADPITSAPQVVSEWGDLRPKVMHPQFEEADPVTGRTTLRDGHVRGIDPNAKGINDRAAWLEGETLKEAMTWLIHVMGKPGNEAIRRAFREAELVVTFRSGGVPMVTVSGKIVSESGRQGIFTDVYLPKNMPDWSDGPVLRETRLSIAVFEALADLWADTLAHTSQLLLSSPSGSVPASTDPENENAAPARAAPTRKRTRKQDHNSIPVGRTSEDMRESENAQALSSCGPSRPLRFRRTPTHYGLAESSSAFASIA